VGLLNNINAAALPSGGAMGGAVMLLFSWGLFKYLVAPLALEKGQENRWALVGVPLILISWGAFLFGVFYAMCAVMTGGKIFMH
jgi:hypothetical protein